MKWLLGIAVLVVVASSWWWYCRRWRRRKEGKAGVPKGRLGWPIIGETLDYIFHGYSSRPEDFMMKRRALFIHRQRSVLSDSCELEFSLLPSCPVYNINMKLDADEQ